eukprot:764561-Hanusia_phi.AAC.3
MPSSNSMEGLELSELPIKVGIIGTGCIGKEHVRNICLMPDVARVVALVDSCEASMKSCTELLPSFQDVATFTNVESMIDWVNEGKDMADHDGRLKAQCEAVVIATPNYTHFSIIREVLFKSSLHILVEKPLCTNVQDCKQVEKWIREDRVKHPRRVVWVGMEYKYIPSVSRLLQEVEKGSVGRVKMVSIREHRFPFLTKVGYWNRFNELSGGTLVEKCCHFFDLMRQIVKSDPVTRWHAVKRRQVLTWVCEGENHCLWRTGRRVQVRSVLSQWADGGQRRRNPAAGILASGGCGRQLRQDVLHEAGYH